jgi:hypothetical protein
LAADDVDVRPAGAGQPCEGRCMSVAGTACGPCPHTLLPSAHQPLARMHTHTPALHAHTQLTQTP